MTTGLLGFNPYGGGTVLDISSKPTQYAIQQMQHQQAKAEAIDKYYKDYEKSLNTQGLTPEEQKIFADKLNEVKGFGIKNREQISNPTKYGYDAQSTLDAGFRNLKDYLAGAKQAAGERKAFKDIHDREVAQGKHVSDNYLDIFNDAMKPYGNGYVQPSLNQVRFYNPHDERKYEQNIVTGVKPAPIETEEKVLDPLTGADTGFSKKVKKSVLTDDQAKRLAENSLSEYHTNLGTQEEFNKLFNDKNLVNNLNKRFGEVYTHKDPVTGQEIVPKIETVEDFARAKGLSKLPKEELVSQTAPTLNDVGKFNLWYKKHKITAQDSKSAYAEFGKQLAAAAGQKVLDKTLDDFRVYDDKGQKVTFGDNPNITKLNVTDDEVKPWVKEDKVYLGIANKITKKTPTTVKKVPAIGEQGDKIYIAYPILDDNGNQTGKYDWNNKINVTNTFKSKLLKETENSPRNAAILGTGLKPPHKM